MSEQLSYKKPDTEGGFLTNPLEIAYYKQQQKNDILENHMLGDFNENGNYVISKKIVQELVGVTKVIQHSYGRTVFCTSAKEVRAYGFLEFALRVERNKPEKGKFLASLELLEPINKVNGYYQNINTVLIATFTEEEKEDYMQMVYKVFNIKLKDDSKGGREKKEDELEEIIARKDYLVALQKLSQRKLSQVERDFYEKRIAALKQSGDYGKNILKGFEEELKKISKLFLNPTNKNYYQSLNQLLDKVLENTTPSLDKDFNDKMAKAIEVYTKDMEFETTAIKKEQLKAATPAEALQIKTQQEIQEKAEKSPVQDINLSKKKPVEAEKVVKVEAEKIVPKVSTPKPKEEVSNEVYRFIVQNKTTENIINPKDINKNIQEAKEVKETLVGDSKKTKNKAEKSINETEEIVKEL